MSSASCASSHRSPGGQPQGPGRSSYSGSFIARCAMAVAATAGAAVGCGPEVPPRAQFAAPQSARVTLALQQEGQDGLESSPRTFLRPSAGDLGGFCRTLLAENPVLREGDRPVRCLELGPVPNGLRTSSDATGVLTLELASDQERATWSSWLAGGRVVLTFPRPGAVSVTN